MKKPVLISFLILSILFILAGLFQTQFFRLRPHEQLPDPLLDSLLRNASEALRTLDVPVGAILLYQGKVIGRGYNTVVSDTNLAGHAEINALNDALKRLGWDHFKELDRHELVMISTYEPCEMCRGAMLHYGILKTTYLKDKTFGRWLRSHVNRFRYELEKRQADGERLQDSLFLLHPDYPGTR